MVYYVIAVCSLFGWFFPVPSPCAMVGERITMALNGDITMVKWQQYRMSEAETHKGVVSKRLLFACAGLIYLNSLGKPTVLRCGGCFAKIGNK